MMDGVSLACCAIAVVNGKHKTTDIASVSFLHVFIYFSSQRPPA
jgi:hypothetical protein